MAFSQSVISSQAPAKCGICETDRPIKWNCIDCSKLLCNHCKENIHPQFQNAKDHQVVNINDLGGQNVVKLSINKQYQTELSAIGNLSYNHDDSMWISNNKYKVLQRVKPDGTKLNILSCFNIKVYGMAASTSNNLLISTMESRLKQININTGTLQDSLYNVSPFSSSAVHITSDNKVLVGGFKLGRRVVILMNQNGDHERVYELDQHQKPIFTCPGRITSTSNGNIHVLDEVSSSRYRLVVLGQGGNIINTYTGHTEITKDIKFLPKDIVTTPRDNVIVSDWYTSSLHILNNFGLLITRYKTSDINILLPGCLAFTPTGQLYIGRSSLKGNTTKVKIYEVTVSEF